MNAINDFASEASFSFFSGDDSALDLCDCTDLAGDLAGDDFTDLLDDDDGGLRLLFIFMGDFFVGDTFALFADIFLPATRKRRHLSELFTQAIVNTNRKWCGMTNYVIHRMCLHTFLLFFLEFIFLLILISLRRNISRFYVVILKVLFALPIIIYAIYSLRF